MSYTCLLADDDASIRELIKEILDYPGLTIIEVNNGDEAIGVLKNHPVDFLITDLVMPQKNGIDVILEVRKSYPLLPIIAISGGGGITGQFDYLPVAGLVGAAWEISKPFSPDDLKKAVDEALLIKK
ncbi:MAG: response regulator [Gammaproteobacteria bacterium]|nr:response regulator [Gammaproteobacteria bacterium]